MDEVHEKSLEREPHGVANAVGVKDKADSGLENVARSSDAGDAINLKLDKNGLPLVPHRTENKVYPLVSEFLP